jgi:hypothetical protein
MRIYSEKEWSWEERWNRMTLNKKSKIICQFYDTIGHPDVEGKNKLFLISDIYMSYLYKIVKMNWTVWRKYLSARILIKLLS